MNLTMEYAMKCKVAKNAYSQWRAIQFARPGISKASTYASERSVLRTGPVQK